MEWGERRLKSAAHRELRIRIDSLYINQICRACHASDRRKGESGSLERIKEKHDCYSVVRAQYCFRSQQTQIADRLVSLSPVH